MSFPASSIGVSDPISLFVCISDTSVVSGVIAVFRSSILICPFSSTGRNVTVNPQLSRYFIVSSIAGCSISDVMRCFPLLAYALAVPISARLSDSVPPDVKMISLSSA